MPAVLWKSDSTTAVSTAVALTAQNIGLKARQKNDRKRNQRHKPRNYEVKS